MACPDDVVETIIWRDHLVRASPSAGAWSRDPEGAPLRQRPPATSAAAHASYPYPPRSRPWYRQLPRDVTGFVVALFTRAARRPWEI